MADEPRREKMLRDYNKQVWDQDAQRGIRQGEVWAAAI